MPYPPSIAPVIALTRRTAFARRRDRRTRSRPWTARPSSRTRRPRSRGPWGHIACSCVQSSARAAPASRSEPADIATPGTPRGARRSTTRRVGAVVRRGGRLPFRQVLGQKRIHHPEQPESVLLLAERVISALELDVCPRLTMAASRAPLGDRSMSAYSGSFAKASTGNLEGPAATGHASEHSIATTIHRRTPSMRPPPVSLRRHPLQSVSRDRLRFVAQTGVANHRST